MNSKKMMKIILISVLLLVITAYAEDAGAESSSDNYVFGDVVNLRSEPSIDAEPIARLKIGTKIEIISETEVIYTQNKLSYNWFKIKADIDGKEVSGYIWGGLIARKAIVDDFDGDQSDEILLLGIANGSDYSTKTAEMRLVKDGKIKSSVKLDLVDDYTYQFGNNKNTIRYFVSMQLLPNEINSFSFIRIDVEAPIFGYFPNYFYLFATNGKTISLIASDDSYCGESTVKEIKLSFKKSSIYIRSYKYSYFGGESPEDKAGIEVKEDQTRKYKFNGRTFVEE
jgi:hypothetical protein